MPKICSSENLARFIVRPPSWVGLSLKLEGISRGRSAGTVNLVQRGQTAREFRDDTLWSSPCLPAGLQGLRMKLLYRGSWLYLNVSCDRRLRASRLGGPGRIGVRNHVHGFKAGDVLEFSCHAAEDG